MDVPVAPSAQPPSAQPPSKRPTRSSCPSRLLEGFDLSKNHRGNTTHSKRAKRAKRAKTMAKTMAETMAKTMAETMAKTMAEEAAEPAAEELLLEKQLVALSEEKLPSRACSAQSYDGLGRSWSGVSMNPEEIDAIVNSFLCTKSSSVNVNAGASESRANSAGSAGSGPICILTAYDSKMSVNFESIAPEFYN